MDYSNTAAMIGIAPPPPPPSHSDFGPQYDSYTERKRSVTFAKDAKHESRRQQKAARANRRDPIHGDNPEPMPLTPTIQRSRDQHDHNGKSDQQEQLYYDPIEKASLMAPLANSVLVERERKRIAAAPSKAFIGRKRMWAGLPTVLFLAPSTYCLTKSCIAWLALGPSTVVFSDSRQGTTASPDPTAQALAMVSICAGAIALICNLLVVAYLRFSRRRTRLGRIFVWTWALIAISLETALAIVNVLLVIFWYRQYTKDPAAPFSSIRNVALRCAGSWEFDVLYTAASYSHTAENAAQVAACAKGGYGTLRNYIIAGSIRTGLFLALGAWWLVVIIRYNRALATSMPSPFEKDPQTTEASDLPESAELHRLLQEEKLDLESRIPGAWDHNSQTVRSHYSGPRSYAEFEHSVIVVTEPDEGVKDLDPYGDQTHATSTWMPPVWSPTYNPMNHLAPPGPRLSRFDWQNNNPSTGEPHQMRDLPAKPTAGHEFGHGNREGSGSFSNWASSLVSSVFGAAMGYSPAPAQAGPVAFPTPQGARSGPAVYDPSTTQKDILAAGPHGHDAHPTSLERGPSKLGVGSWFGGRKTDNAGAAPHPTEALAVQPTLNYYAEHESEAGMSSARTSMSDLKGENYAEWSQRNFAGLAAMDANRSSFRSSTAPTPVTHVTRNVQVSQDASVPGRRFSTESQGDMLPHMPEARELGRRLPNPPSGHGGSTLSPPQAPTWRPSGTSGQQSGPPSGQSHSSQGIQQHAAPQGATRHQRTNSTDFWVEDNMRGLGSSAETGDLLPPKPEPPTFVRQLGQLVRKLSAIESVGSAGERERSSSGSATPSHSNLMMRGGVSGTSWTGRGASGSQMRMGSVEEEEPVVVQDAGPRSGMLSPPPVPRGHQGHLGGSSDGGRLPGGWRW
ncbi:hypothetical protein OC846_003070 [Tilletia horrida]|uniref:Uncharacterized protein n=1 Tax=Tilletia horrida TaxID=155126 RepID=A0AAN6GVK8_9BASI|nr:hypothetical protein OC845_002815 [Tilletia horrida]KAK0551986.1 hypothetical protein OC846_003070 [Tilletia horrida]KAK0566169.1 hypothetical protein OC861_003390 [Tilletia horrida]